MLEHHPGKLGDRVRMISLRSRTVVTCSQQVTLPRNRTQMRGACAAIRYSSLTLETPLNWRSNRSALHKANGLPRVPRYRASGVSHPAWQCGSLSFLLLEPPSPWQARRGENTQTSERCVVYILHVIPLIVSLLQAAEKSLSLLRSSPEQVTANLASGTFPSFVIIQIMCQKKVVERAHCLLIAFWLRQASWSHQLCIYCDARS